jgi:alpha/beta superfamily hydrolase
MHATVIDRLFHELPVGGVPTLRFNFRGVQGSDGRHDHGDRERFDVMAAVEMATERRPSSPVRLIGWSFGADVSLATTHPAIDGWIAIAPPLRVIEPSEMAAATDPRPAVLLTGEHDAFRPPDEARNLTATWLNTTVTEIPGADHFFGGALSQLVEQVAARLGSH